MSHHRCCDCDADAGACCLRDGRCQELSESECLSRGGVFVPDERCADVRCRDDCCDIYGACGWRRTGFNPDTWDTRSVVTVTATHTFSRDDSPPCSDSWSHTIEHHSGSIDSTFAQCSGLIGAEERADGEHCVSRLLSFTRIFSFKTIGQWQDPHGFCTFPIQTGVPRVFDPYVVLVVAVSSSRHRFQAAINLRTGEFGTEICGINPFNRIYEFGTASITKSRCGNVTLTGAHSYGQRLTGDREIHSTAQIAASLDMPGAVTCRRRIVGPGDMI